MLRVALVDRGNDFGIGTDVRVFVTDAATIAAGPGSEPARYGRAFRGRRNGRYTGPTKQGILMRPGDADEPSELLALAEVKVESISAGGAE